VLIGQLVTPTFVFFLLGGNGTQFGRINLVGLLKAARLISRGAT
jgi:hypothetical protein